MAELSESSFISLPINRHYYETPVNSFAFFTHSQFILFVSTFSIQISQEQPTFLFLFSFKWYGWFERPIIKWLKITYILSWNVPLNIERVEHTSNFCRSNITIVGSIWRIEHRSELMPCHGKLSLGVGYAQETCQSEYRFVGWLDRQTSSKGMLSIFFVEIKCTHSAVCQTFSQKQCLFFFTTVISEPILLFYAKLWYYSNWKFL